MLAKTLLFAWLTLLEETTEQDLSALEDVGASYLASTIKPSDN